MRHCLGGDAIERNKDRQPLTCSANRLSVLVHRDVSPGHERRVCLLRLCREDRDVVRTELDLVRPSDRQNGLGDIFFGGTEP
jgi:hypothetical protein